MTILRYSVADCGGTSTNWAFCYEDGSIQYVNSVAMHPKYLLDWTREQLESLRLDLPEDITAPLFFYAAGCNNPEIAGRVQEVLIRMGFSEVVVFPDTLGACRACCGDNPGSVAILGTGSVLLQYDGKQVSEHIGGWGSLIGDEGSGFHFGRLLLKAYLKHNPVLTSPILEQLEKLIGSRQQVLGQLALPAAQRWVADLANKVADLDLSEIHQCNISEFITTYISDRYLTNDELVVVGSYGWFQQEYVREELAKAGLKLGNVVKNPLDHLIDYHR